jgi:hypothetical protein
VRQQKCKPVSTRGYRPDDLSDSSIGRFLRIMLRRFNSSQYNRSGRSTILGRGHWPVAVGARSVTDLEENFRLVREGGGEIMKESTDAGYAVIRDPVGVCAGLQANG